MLLPARPAPAGPPAKGAAAKDPAREHFDAAQALYDQKKYDPALILFRQAHAETKSPNAHLMIGLSLLALGRLTEAYDELAATVREAAARAETEPRYAKTRDAAAAELAPLEAKVGKVIVTLADAAPDARVTVNGAAVPPEKLGVPMAVLPGKVEVVAVRPGTDPLRSEQTLSAGETRTIVLAAKKGDVGGPSVSPARSGASAAPSTTPAPEAPTTGGGVRMAGYVVTGIGVLGMVAFGVGAGLAEGKIAQLEKECGGARCTEPKYADVVDSGKTLDLVATVGLVSGIAGLAGGVTMILLGGPRKVEAEGGAAGASRSRPRAPAPKVAIDVSPGRAMVQCSGSF